MSKYEQFDFSENRPKRKKSIKSICYIAVGSLLTLVLLAFAVNWIFGLTLGSSIKQMVLGDKEYYLSLEKKNLSDGAKAISKDVFYAAGITELIEKMAYESDIDFDVSDMSFITQNQDYNKEMTDIINKLSFNINSNSYEGINEKKIIIKKDGNEALKADLYTKGNQISIKFPDIYDKYFVMNSSIPYSIFNSFFGNISDVLVNSNKKLDLGIDEIQLSSVIKEYADIYTDNIGEVKIEKKKSVDVNGIAVPCSKITVTFTASQFSNILLKILEKAKADDVLYQLFSDYTTYKNGNLTKDQYSGYIDSIISSINNGSIEKYRIYFVSYVDKDENIISRDLNGFGEKGGSIKFNYTAQVTKSRIFINSSFNLASSQQTFEIQQQQQQRPMAMFSLNLDTERDNDKWTGKVDSRMYSNILPVYYRINYEFEDANIEINDNDQAIINGTFKNQNSEFVIKGDENKHEIDVNLNINKSNAGSIKVITKNKANSSFQMPLINDDNCIYLDRGVNIYNEKLLDDEVSQKFKTVFGDIGFLRIQEIILELNGGINQKRIIPQIR